MPQFLISYLSYALMALLIGLGVFIICRPKPTATKSEK